MKILTSHAGTKKFIRGILKRLVLLPLYTISSFILYIFARLMTPARVIRFGLLDVSRIGAFYSVDYSQIENQISRKPFLNLWFSTKSIPNKCNSYWINIWSIKIYIIPFSHFGHYLVTLFKKLPYGKLHLIPTQHEYYSTKNLRLLEAYSNSKPQINLPEDLIINCKKQLDNLQIDVSNGYICFHSRDPAYLNSIDPSRNWSYHNYRDSNINNYVIAVSKFLQHNNILAFRMGAIVNSKLSIINSRIIDYSSLFWSEVMDLYLGSQCKFFVCSDAGITIIPETFRRPIVLTNFTTYYRIRADFAFGVMILKKHYLRSESRYLNTIELITNPKFRIDQHDSNHLSLLGVELIENTPEEIYDAMVEINSRICGNWIEDTEDAELQNVFWSQFNHIKFRPKNFFLCAKFLRDNKKFLVPAK